MLTSLILLTLNFLGTWYLETTLKNYYRFEFVVLGALLLFAIWLISAELQRLKGAWRVSTVYFSLSILNLTFLFLVTGHFFTFALTTVIALAGLLRSVGRINHLPDLPPKPVKLETYHLNKQGEPLEVDPVMWVHPDDLVTGNVRPSRVTSSSVRTAARKSSRKTARKTSRKKSSRKKSARKSSRKKTSRKTSRKKSSRRR